MCRVLTASESGFAALRLGAQAESQALVLNALRMARFKRKPKPEPIHHSNRSGRYYSHDYQAFIAEMKAVSSMSPKDFSYLVA
ncbi:MAG: hypothetical protein ACK5DL_09055 [Burkholderiales bacterium]